MQVVLLERIEKLGQMGDVVTVKDGFARNYLVPQGKALRATKANLADFERRRVQLEAAICSARGSAEACQADRRSLGGDPAAGGRSGPALWLGQSPRHRRGVHRGWRDHRAPAGSTPGGPQELGIHQVRIRLHPEVDTFVPSMSHALGGGRDPGRSRACRRRGSRSGRAAAGAVGSAAGVRGGSARAR